MKNGLLKYLLFLTLGASILTPAQATTTPFVVHEWGTFTSFMGANGQLMEGMHTEEETLPGFVYSLKKDGNISNLQGLSFNDQMDFQFCRSKIPCDLLGRIGETRAANNFIPANPLNYGVTQKMETPVIYFYGETNQKFEIHIDFPQGIMSQWYPKASQYSPRAEKITTLGPSSLTYNVTLKDPSFVGNMPKTTFDSIWNPAREVKANTIEVENQNEKFIFYRGVADFNSALKVTSNLQNQLTLTNLLSEKIAAIFILNSDGDKGTINALGAINPHAALNTSLPQVTSGLAFDQYVIHAKNIIQKALVAQGLFADEARGLVNTWEKSYFNTPGPRVLFLLPQSETERILPLKISKQPSSLVRVLIGRIEFMTKQQELDYLETLNKTTIINKEDLFGRFYEPKMRRLLNVLKEDTHFTPVQSAQMIKKINSTLGL